MKIRVLYLSALVVVSTMLITPAAAQSFQNDNENNGLSENKETKLHEQNIEMDAPVKYVDTGHPDYDDLVYKQKLIAYLRGVEGMPEYQATGNRSDDRETFMKEMKIWYEAHPEYLDVLDLRTFEAFQKYDASCYPNPPEYTKGCSPKEEEAYRKSFRIWMAHHPEAPKLQGDDQASKDEFEREKAKFYELYFKK